MKKHLILLFLLITSVFAQEDYKCKVENVIIADKSKTSLLSFYKKTYTGSEFTVNRESGIMSGELKNHNITKPEIIAYGNQEDSYKVVTTMTIEEGLGKGTNVYTLIIEEHKNTKYKPFIFLQNSEIYMGNCIHY